MNNDYDYDQIAHTCSSQEILRIMLEQSAEIERLKEEKQHAGVECISYIGQLAQAQVELKICKQLIAELADALQASGVRQYSNDDDAIIDVDKLLQRAREATKNE